MSRLSLILPLVVLAGCTSNVALKDASETSQTVGTLTMTWLRPNSMEVTLDGKRYVGEWDTKPCLNEYCRGVYRNVQKLHRRHINKGSATLRAKEGGQMDCAWVSHLPEVRGECRTEDGRIYSLRESE